MTDEATRNQQRALLVRAAHLEAQRQAAHQAQDWPKVAGLERELLRLYREHADLETRKGRDEATQ